MDLLYDHREDKSSVPALLEEKGLSLESSQLSMGDYIIGERICIERKSAPDFVASLKDGRLWDQLLKMKEAYDVVVLILEGEPLFPPAPLEGAYAGIVRRGASLFRVPSPKETASFIYRMWLQENKPRGSRKPRQVRRWRGEDEVAEDCLAALPGISINKAGDLLNYFKSLEGVARATESELLEVPGIGKKTAKDIRDVFTHQRGELPWD